MKLPTWISFIAVKAASAEQACQADSAADCDGQACSWNAETATCQLDMLSEGIAMAALDAANSDMANQGGAKSASLSALGVAGLHVMTNSPLLGGLDLQNWLPYSNYNYQANLMSPGGFFGNQMTQKYYTCPLDVPFCARQACTAHIDAENNAYSCYSDPGCCFDQNLYLHKQMFGSNFYKTVPVCYRAIDNPLFSQLAQEITANGDQFKPAYITPIVNKVLNFMNSPITSSALTNYMQCAPADKTYQAYEFLSHLQASFPSQATTINWMMSVDSYFDDLISVLTPSCGWSEINQQECVLAGCCWSAKGACQRPLPFAEITEAQLNDAITHVNFLKFIDTTSKSGSVTAGSGTGKSLNFDINDLMAVQAVNNGQLNDPLYASIFQNSDLQSILNLQALTSPNANHRLAGPAIYAALNNQKINLANMGGGNLAQMANILSLTSDSSDLKQKLITQIAAQTLGMDANTLWVLENQAGSGQVASSATDLTNGLTGSSPSGLTEFFKYQALFGGQPDFAKIFGDDGESTCPAAEVSINCMAASQTKPTDFLGLHKEKALCKAKGCCWEGSRQTQNALGLGQFNCPWNNEFSLYTKFTFLPSLNRSLRGCCKISSCVQPEARQTSVNPVNISAKAEPVNAVTATQVGEAVETNAAAPSGGVAHAKFTPWETTSCTVSCGGGTMTKYRDCVSGCENVRYKREYKKVKCNAHPCEFGFGSINMIKNFGK